MDTTQDLSLPWSPTATLRTILSDKNFFEVFYPNMAAKVNYFRLDKTPDSATSAIVVSNKILGY